jgi:hypothetical protein
LAVQVGLVRSDDDRTAKKQPRCAADLQFIHIDGSPFRDADGNSKTDPACCLVVAKTDPACCLVVGNRADWNEPATGPSCYLSVRWTRELGVRIRSDVFGEKKEKLTGHDDNFRELV